ncbi:MAG TPA: hypothetical protein VF210_17225, partial [Pseudomonadales bacterium]
MDTWTGHMGHTPVTGRGDADAEGWAGHESAPPPARTVRNIARIKARERGGAVGRSAGVQRRCACAISHGSIRLGTIHLARIGREHGPNQSIRTL